uniref:RNA-binding S4 domain-containing protein n=1 Tax=Kalanchoe fedtschenkoi TaxID=63787 RepID=A0A7N0UJT4_KALFE
MFSHFSLSSSSFFPHKAFQASSFLSLIPERSSPRTGVVRIFRACCASDSQPVPDYEPPAGRRSNFSGLKFNELADVKSGKVRLDAWITSRIDGVSRARVESSIKAGLVSVNGRVVSKVSYNVKDGDSIDCTISELQPLSAEPEDIPLDIVYEDDHVLVVNKAAHMVVHPAPGNPTGTLVNGILHHCSLPTVVSVYKEETELYDGEEMLDDEFGEDPKGLSSLTAASIRPGIVHRLDKGTSGLLVVAKQFKLHTIHRIYISLTCGVPRPVAGRVDVPIGRDPNNRTRMIAAAGQSSVGHARHAASRYKVIEVLAGGASALVEWRLETGRTHQIRAHAKYLGIPLLGDELYGGTQNKALSMLRSKTPPSCHPQLAQIVSKLERPCLHALALGFKHPLTEEILTLSRPPPEDFAKILGALRKIGFQKAA